MNLKLLRKEQFKKQLEHLGILLAIKFVIKLQDSQKLHLRIIQKHLQIKN